MFQGTVFPFTNDSDITHAVTAAEMLFVSNDLDEGAITLEGIIAAVDISMAIVIPTAIEKSPHYSVCLLLVLSIPFVYPTHS